MSDEQATVARMQALRRILHQAEQDIARARAEIVQAEKKAAWARGEISRMELAQKGRR